MALARTNYTENTPKNYWMNAASVFKNVTFTEQGGHVGDPLVGATTGAVTVTIEQNYRNPEVNGTSHLQGKVKGNTVLESAVARIVFNAKEIKPENLRLGLNGSIRDALATEAPAGYKIIETKRYLDDSDYLTNIGVLGTLSGSTDPVFFIMENALCTGGIEIGTEDNGEAIIEYTFEAHASAAQLLSDKFPWHWEVPTIA